MKTNAQILLFVLCFFIIESKAQIYFNNRYDTFGSCDGTNGIDTMFNGYVSAEITCSSVSYYTFLLNSYHYDGTINKSKPFLIPNTNFLPNSGKYVRINTTQFYVSGERTYKTDTTMAFLWRFNFNLDSLFYKEYGYINQTNVVTSFIKSTNYIYMVGYNDILSTNSDVLLIKTDTAGNEIWKKKIGIAGWDESAYTIKSCANNNLLISGLKRGHNSSYGGDYVLRVDTSGAIIWQYYYPSTNYAAGSLDVMELPNGNIAFTGDDAFNTGPDGVYRKPTLGLLDANGNLIWRKSYGGKFVGHDFYKLLINHKNNFVTCGTIGYSSSIVNGMAYEISQNGDSIFSREYAMMPGSQNYFRDVIQTNDGGYCFAGFVSPVFANGGTGTEDIWLLKVDSNFCESASSCGYGVGLAPLSKAEELGLRLYPNPANDILNIELEMINESPVTIEISNALGQVVLSEASISQTVKLKTNFLPSGMYYLSVKTKDKTVISKFIEE